MSTYPLGVDIGSERVRVALTERIRDGVARLIAVAVRPVAGDPVAALTDAARELGTRERRCVVAIDEPDAVLRSVTFPAMRARERERAARFEGARFVDFPMTDAIVRVHATSTPGRYTVGIANRARVAELAGIVRRAKLRLTAIDHTAFALQRALPETDAIVDIGRDRSAVYIFGGELPAVSTIALGGAHFTSAIAASLGIDDEAAERRKRAHGLSGSAAGVRDMLVEGIHSALIDVRAAGRGDINRIVLAGNGARIAEIAPSIERATSTPTKLATLAPEQSDSLPPDVLRAAAPDWSIAFGLALWQLAS